MKTLYNYQGRKKLQRIKESIRMMKGQEDKKINID